MQWFKLKRDFFYTKNTVQLQMRHTTEFHSTPKTKSSDLKIALPDRFPKRSHNSKKQNINKHNERKEIV